MSYLDLKKIRKDLQITQDRLAELCGITRRTLINWEKNPDNIPYASAQFLMSLADGASTGDNLTPDGIIPSNPCDRLAREDKPKMSARDRQYLTREELSRLASTDCRSAEVKRAFMFSCFCGLRFSDVRNLKWEDFYTANGRTYIHIRIVKTRTPITIPLSPLALSWLPERGRGSVFSLPTVPAVCDNLALWVENAGIRKHITFHCARHTFATMSISAGVDLFAVSKLLGHTDVKTTQIYAKMMDERKTEAVDALAGFYERKEEGQRPSLPSEQH